IQNMSEAITTPVLRRPADGFAGAQRDGRPLHTGLVTEPGRSRRRSRRVRPRLDSARGGTAGRLESPHPGQVTLLCSTLFEINYMIQFEFSIDMSLRRGGIMGVPPR